MQIKRLLRLSVKKGNRLLAFLICLVIVVWTLAFIAQGYDYCQTILNPPYIMVSDSEYISRDRNGTILEHIIRDERGNELSHKYNNYITYLIVTTFQ